MNQLEASILVNLGGDAQKGFERLGSGVTDFARTGNQQLTGFQRTVRGVDRGVNRLGNRVIGLASGAAMGVAIKSVGDLSERLNQLGINAGFNGIELTKFKDNSITSIESAADAFAVHTGLIIDGIEAIVEKTGNIQFATDNMRNLAMAIGATSGEGLAFGRILADLESFEQNAPEDILKMFDMLVAQGQMGAFVLNDFAKEGPRLFSAYKPHDIQQLKELGAAMQVIMKSTGVPAEAVTSFQALMRTLTDKKKVGKLLKAGIKVFDEEGLEKYRRKVSTLSDALLPITDIMKSIAEVSGGDTFKLSQWIDDSEARKGLSKLMDEQARTGKTESIDVLLNVNSDGSSITQDAIDNVKEFNAQLRRLKVSWDSFANNNLAGPVSEFADGLAKLDAEGLENILDTTKKIVLGIGGVVVALKTARLLFGTFNAVKTAFGKGEKGGNGLGGSSMAPVPVFVVNNMGSGGPGGRKGKGLPGGPGKSTTNVKKATRIKNATRLGNITQLLNPAALKKLLGTGVAAAGAPAIAGAVVAGGGIAYGIGTLLDRYLIDGSAAERSFQNTLPRLLAALGNDNAQRRLAIEASFNNPQPIQQPASAADEPQLPAPVVPPAEPNDTVSAPQSTKNSLSIEVDVSGSTPQVYVTGSEENSLDMDVSSSMGGL